MLAAFRVISSACIRNHTAVQSLYSGHLIRVPSRDSFVLSPLYSDVSYSPQTLTGYWVGPDTEDGWGFCRSFYWYNSLNLCQLSIISFLCSWPLLLWTTNYWCIFGLIAWLVSEFVVHDESWSTIGKILSFSIVRVHTQYRWKHSIERNFKF